MPEREHLEPFDLDALVQALAANLREARARSNWSTRALSQQCQVDRRTIQRLEGGLFPGVSLRTLDAISKGLGVRTSSLLGKRVVSRDDEGVQAADALGRNLASLRAACKLTQDGLASHSGVPRSVIAAVETGTRNPALTTLFKLARGLGVSVAQLVLEDQA